MKKNFKRIVAGVLAFTLATTGLSVDWNRGSEVEAANTEFVTLDGYTPLTISDWVDTTTGNPMADDIYSAQNNKKCLLPVEKAASLDKTMVSMKIKFVTSGLNTRMYIAEKQNASSGLGMYVSEDGTELYLRDFNQNLPMTNNGAPSWKITYTASDARVETFKNKEFLLQMSFEYGDFNNDSVANEVKIGMYFNGTLYKGSETVIENCNMDRFGTRISFEFGSTDELQLASAKVEKRVEPVCLKDYKQLTLSDYINTTNGEVMQDQGYNKNSYTKFKTSDGSIASFDKTVLSMKMKFVTSGLNTRMYIAEKQNASSGLGIYVSDDGRELYLRDFNQNLPMTNNGAPSWKITYTASDAGVETFKNKEILLQMSFDYGDFNHDGVTNEMKVGMYFNGKLYKDSETLIENCNMDRFGTRISFEFGSTDELQLASVKVEIPPEPICLQGYKHLTLSDYINTTNGEVMQDQGYNKETYKSFKLRDDKIAGFNKIVLSMKMKFVTSGLNTRMYIAEKQNASSGLGIYVSDNGTELYLRDFNQNLPMTNNGAPSWKITYTASDAGFETFKNKEFLLQMSFEYGDFNQDGVANEIKVGMYFNGKLYKDSETLIENCNMERFGTRISLDFGSTDELQLASVKVAEPLEQDYLQNYKHLTLSDYINTTNGEVMQDQGYSKNSYTKFKLSDGSITSFDKTVLSMKMKFVTSGLNTRMYIAEKQNASSGLGIYVSDDGRELYLRDFNQNLPMTNNGAPSWKITYTASDAGVETFKNKEFLLQISFDYGDFNHDGVTNEIKVGVYFNGKLYKDSETLIENCNIDRFGTRIGLDLSDASESLYLSSVTAEPMPIYVNGFSHVTISDFGNTSITSLTDKTYVQGDASTCWLTSGVGTLKDTVVSMKVKFGTGGKSTGFCIGNTGGKVGFLVYVEADGSKLHLYDLRDSSTENMTGIYRKDVTYDALTVGLQSFLDTEFLLQISFEYENEMLGQPGDPNDPNYNPNLSETTIHDVKIGMYINGKLYNGEKTTLKACRKEHFGSHLDLHLDASDSKLSLASVDVDTEMHHNLTHGAYSYVDGAMALVNQSKRAGIYLDKPGDYDVVLGTAQTTKKVITYLEGDVNIDGAVDVRDIIAGKKALQTTPETKAAKLGMDMDRDDKLTATDVGKIRTFLVTGANESISYIGEGVMPIAGFWGPTNQHVNNEMFQKIADMGLNLISYTALDYKSSPELVKNYLTLADKHKIGVFVTDSNVTEKANGTAVKKSEIAQALAAYRNYPAFCGMYLVDEPHTDYYGQKGSGVLVSQLGSLAKVLQKDFDLTCYANLFGIGSAKADGENAYERYVKEFCETVRPKVLMWDYYVYSDNGTVSQYFENMSIIRKYAEQYNIPFWSFIQAGNDWYTDKSSTEGYSYSPNQSEFEWNVNTSLAFGAKGIQYFPLIQPGSFYADCKDYRQNGLIGADGNTNQWYDYAKKMNTQIAAVDEVLINSVNKGIILSGSASAVSAETSEYLISSGSFQALQSVTGDCLVGCFNYQGRTALYVVNYSTEAKNDVTLTLNKTYTVKTVQNANSSSEQTNNITLNMAAGEGVLVVVQ